MKVRNELPYFLPKGLPDGATVKVLAFQAGYRVVEYRGERYTVSITAIDRPLVPVEE